MKASDELELIWFDLIWFFPSWDFVSIYILISWLSRLISSRNCLSYSDDVHNLYFVIWSQHEHQQQSTGDETNVSTPIADSSWGKCQPQRCSSLLRHSYSSWVQQQPLPRFSGSINRNPCEMKVSFTLLLSCSVGWYVSPWAIVTHWYRVWEYGVKQRLKAQTNHLHGYMLCLETDLHLQH